ncbi:FecR family protein [Porticoccaceae bacterium LTM1]|nr:FecR family protein [Porticoccaceae bacterium LTM1]
MSRQPTNGDQTYHDEATIERLLHAIGPRKKLPEDTQRKWENAFQQELSQTIRKRRIRRATAYAALCASALLLMIYTPFQQPDSNSENPLASVITISGNVDFSLNQISQPLLPDDVIQSGSRIETGLDSQLGLQLSGLDLRVNQQTVLQLFHGQILLQKGQIYISTNKAATHEDSIKVVTPLAEIQHVGTQYQVNMGSDGVATLVREGAIRIKFDTDEINAIAEEHFARKVTISNDLQLNEQRINKSGSEWNWILQSAPTFNIEGRSAFDFLQWASRETGLKLIFDNSQTQTHAKLSHLSGDISMLNPDQAIEPVLATTRLVADRSIAGELTISMTGN